MGATNVGFMCAVPVASCGGGAGPVTIASVTPADATRHVGVFTPVVATLSGPADATTIGAGTATIFVGETGQPVVADVAYDPDAATITITPAYPLAAATSYRVALNGITAGSTAVAPVTARFRTVENAISDRTSWRDDGSPDQDVRYEYDAQDRPSKTILVADANGNPDWWSFDYPAPDVEHESLTFDGADGVPQTADDMLGYVVVDRSSRFGVTTRDRFDKPGDDGMWFTADDVGTARERTAYDALGRVLTESTEAAGRDEVFDTADDVIGGPWHGFVYTAHEDVDLLRVDPGPDATWFTDDDRQSVVVDTRRDDRGGVTSSDSFDCGPDIHCNTSDDEQFDELAVERDAHGSIVRTVERGSAGPDFTWGDADDPVALYTTYARDAQGNAVTVETWRAGADGVIGTSDDVRIVLETHDTTR